MAALNGTWRKSSKSSESANCVELRVGPDGLVEVRDSKDPAGPVLRFSTIDVEAFFAGVRAGEFD
jgi:hypothetical protein